MDGIRKVDTGSENELLHLISDSPIFTPPSPEELDEKAVPVRVGRVEAMAARFDMLDKRIRYLDQSKYSKLDPVRFEIAKGLYMISAEKLYTIGGYTSISVYAKNVLGMTSVLTSAYCRVAKRFIRKNWPETIFSSVADPNKPMEDFTMYQLIELLRLSEDEIRRVLADGRLTFSMSVQKIKDLVKVVKREAAEAEKAEAEGRHKELDVAYEAFIVAYDKLKDYLDDMQETFASDTLLPEIMGAVIKVYQEGLKGYDTK